MRHGNQRADGRAEHTQAPAMPSSSSTHAMPPHAAHQACSMLVGRPYAHATPPAVRRHINGATIPDLAPPTGHVARLQACHMPCHLPHCHCAMRIARRSKPQRKQLQANPSRQAGPTLTGHGSPLVAHGGCHRPLLLRRMQVLQVVGRKLGARAALAEQRRPDGQHPAQAELQAGGRGRGRRAWVAQQCCSEQCRRTAAARCKAQERGL